MRLIIASDLHGSASAATRVRDKMSEMKADMLLILGDILYHGPRNPLPEGHNPAEVAKILSALSDQVVAVKGNCEADVDQMVLPFHISESAWLFDEGRRMMAIHGHQLTINGGPIKAPSGIAVLSGHTHLPTAELREGTHFWNPGSASLPKGGFPPSFGLYNQGKFEVLTFDGQPLMNNSF